MKVQQVYRTEKLGGNLPGVYMGADLLERRGRQAVTRATGQFAREMFKLGQDVQTAVRCDLVSHNYALAQKAIADTELELRRDPDHRSIPQKYSQALDDIRANYSSNIYDPVARNMFQQKFLQYQTAAEIKMKHYVYAREQDAQYAHLVEELDTKARLIENTDINDLKTYQILMNEGLDSINQRLAMGYIREDKAVELRKEWRERTSRMRAYRSVMNDPFRSLDVLAGNQWKRYFPYLSEEKRLDYLKQAETRINQIQTAVKSQETIEKANEKALQERMAEMQKTEFLKKIQYPRQFGQLTPMEILDNELLTSSEKEHFVKVLTDTAKKGAESIYEKTDETLYGQWKRRIYLEPESIKNSSEIWALHGKGLSTGNVSELTELWEKRTKEPKEPKSLSLTRATKTLDAMLKLGIFGDIKDEDEVLQAYTKHNELMKSIEIFVDSNADADDKKIMEYVKEITTDDQKGLIAEIWEKWSNLVTWPMLNLGTGIETKPVDEKRLKAIGILRDANRPATEANIKYVMENMD